MPLISDHVSSRRIREKNKNSPLKQFFEEYLMPDSTRPRHDFNERMI